MENWKQFLAWEKVTNDTIDFKKIYVDIVGKKGIVGKKNGDVVSGLLLSQIVYWYLPNKDNKSKLREFRFDHYWIVKERHEWYDEIRLTEANYKTAIKRLEDENLVEKRVFKPAVFGRKKTATCIRLNIPEFLRRLNLILQHEQESIPDEEIDFDTYIEQQFEESGTVESTNPNGDMGMVESTNPKERSNQPILRNGEINQSLGSVESTSPYITENTSETLYRDYDTESLLNSSSIDSDTENNENDDEETINPMIPLYLKELGFKEKQVQMIVKELEQRKHYTTFSKLDFIEQAERYRSYCASGKRVTKLGFWFVEGMEMYSDQSRIERQHQEIRRQNESRDRYRGTVPFYNWLEERR